MSQTPHTGAAIQAPESLRSMREAPLGLAAARHQSALAPANELLDRALQDVVDGTVEIPGVDLALLERIWPVLIVPSCIIQSEIVWAHIYDRAPDLFASHPSFQRPTLLSIDDFERAMAIVEAGTGLPALLDERARSLFAAMPPSHFFASRYPNAGRPRYVDSHLVAVGEDARSSLGFG
jgi:hypothetical protein